jgi:hypothetical protein
LEKVPKTRCSIRPFLKRGLLLALGWKLRETSAARPPPAARVEEACLFVGKKFTVLSSTPETGYEEPVADRESIGPGGTMVGESPRLGAFRVYGGYSGT